MGFAAFAIKVCLCPFPFKRDQIAVYTVYIQNFEVSNFHILTILRIFAVIFLITCYLLRLPPI